MSEMSDKFCGVFRMNIRAVFMSFAVFTFLHEVSHRMHFKASLKMNFVPSML